MSFMKNGLLFAAGGLAGLVLAAILEAESDSGSSRHHDWDDDDDDEDDDDDYVPRRKRMPHRKSSDAAEKSVGRPSLDGIVKSVKADAEAAMAACSTDEECEEVYEKVSDTLRELQELLANKGEEIIEALRAKADIQSDEDDEATERKREAETHVSNLRETAEEVASALDEVLASLKPQAE